MKEILFVCTGNTCRSPMAAALMQDELSRRGVCDVTAKSAGISARDGEPASENAVKVMAEKGIDISAHSALRVTGKLISDAEIIYAITPSHMNYLAERYPQFADKIRVLGEGAADPFGGDIELYRTVRDILGGYIADMARAICHEG